MNEFIGAFRGRRPAHSPGSETIRAGLLTDYELRTSYRAVYRNVYLANDIALTAELRARAAWLFAGPDAVLGGICTELMARRMGKCASRP